MSISEEKLYIKIFDLFFSKDLTILNKETICKYLKISTSYYYKKKLNRDSLIENAFTYLFTNIKEKCKNEEDIIRSFNLKVFKVISNKLYDDIFLKNLNFYLPLIKKTYENIFIKVYEGKLIVDQKDRTLEHIYYIDSNFDNLKNALYLKSNYYLYT